MLHRNRTARTKCASEKANTHVDTSVSPSRLLMKQRPSATRPWPGAAVPTKAAIAHQVIQTNATTTGQYRKTFGIDAPFVSLPSRHPTDSGCTRCRSGATIHTPLLRRLPELAQQPVDQLLLAQHDVAVVWRPRPVFRDERIFQCSLEEFRQEGPLLLAQRHMNLGHWRPLSQSDDPLVLGTETCFTSLLYSQRVCPFTGR